MIPPPPSGRSIALIPASETHGTRDVRSGTLTRVIRGVYAPSSAWSALPPWGKYGARVRAGALRHPDAVLFLEAAACAWELPIFGDPGDVHILGDDAKRSRESGSLRVHTSTDERELHIVDGMLSTGLADTVVDIARARHRAIGLAVADAALRQDPRLTVEQLVALNESRLSSRGRRSARWVLHRATAKSESPLESIDRAVIEWLGLPDPHLQVWFDRDRVDMWWEKLRIAGEADGDAKYTGTDAEANRRAMRERHERDLRLFARGARAVPHWGWAETIAVDPLDAILRSAGVTPIRPRESLPLATLRRALNPSRNSARTQTADETTA